jgi:hypothetical protein
VRSGAEGERPGIAGRGDVEALAVVALAVRPFRADGGRLDRRKNLPPPRSTMTQASGGRASQPCRRVPASCWWQRSAEKPGAV